MHELNAARSRMRRLVTTKFYDNTCGNGYYCKIPGFSYRDINRSGFYGRLKIHKLLESSRVNRGFNNESLTNFFFGAETVIRKKLYDEVTLTTPLILRSYMCKIGNTSMDHISFVEKDDDTKKPEDNVIITQINRVVNIDLNLRKPVPIPEEHKKKAEKIIANLPFQAPTFPSVDLNTFTIPEKNFTHRIQVRYDDMDFLNHANQGSYTIFTGECAAAAADSGFYWGIDRDVACYPTSYEFNLHKGESRPGDMLDVTTWQDDIDHCTAYFVVKKNQKPIYYSKLQFYTDL